MTEREGSCYTVGKGVYISGAVAIGLLLIVLGLPHAAQAGGPWYVTPAGSDDNDCLSWETACQTIESAVSKADSGDTVFLAAGVFTRGATVDKDLIFQGMGADDTIVAVSVSSRVFTVTGSCAVTMTGLAITGGNATEGGGIYNEGTLALDACAVYSNTAAGSDGVPSLPGSPGLGGGIYSSGTLSLSDCVIHDNLAVGGDGGDGEFARVGDGGNGVGGGIYSTGSLTLDDCVVRDNMAIGGNGGIDEISGGYEGRGGAGIGSGIYTQGMLELRNSTLDGNTAIGGIGGSRGVIIGSICGGGTLIVNNTGITNNIGGGMYTDPYISGYSMVEVSNSILSDNTGIGIRDTCANTLDCTLILKNSTVSGNQGGGIVTSGASAGSTSVVSITGSTISGNTASYQGGGIISDNQIGGNKTLVLVNSTISGNDGGVAGGGIRVSSTSQSTNLVKIINTSIISNTADSGSAIYADAGGSGLSLVTLENSIVASDSPSEDCLTGWGGEIVSHGHNMDSGNSCGFAATGDITDTDPHLGPLQDNGGGTYTQALLPGSPATDAGNPATCMVAPVNGVDQRGFPRDAACDIGAYEVEKYAALDIVKRVSSDTVWSGERLTYTIQVTNTGNVALTATITDSLPDHVSPGGTLTWTAPISASGCVWTEQFTVTVELGYSGPLTNVVRATTEEGATGAYTHTVTVYGAPVAGFTSSSPDWSGETTAFTNTTTGHGSLTYLWSFGDGVTSTLESPTHTYSAAGTCTVALTATNSAGSSVATDAVTIYDTPVVDFSSAVYSASEDAGAVNITVTLDAVSDLTVTVDYVASDGTATAGSDYVVISGTLIFTPGVTSQVIVVAIIDDDVVEGEEVVILTLTDPHNAVLGDHSPAALTITETFRIYLPQVLRYQVLAP